MAAKRGGSTYTESERMKALALRALSLLVIMAAVELRPHGITPIQASGTRSTQGHNCVFDHLTLHTGPNACRPRAKAYPKYVKDAVERAIYDSALVFGVPYTTLLEVARCESALNPKASNGSHFGLFQFAPQTFYRAVSQMKRDTGLQARTYWNPLDSSYAAGFMFVVGSAESWSCVSAITSAPA